MYIRVLFLAMITFAAAAPSFAQQQCNANITATTGHLKTVDTTNGTVSDNKTKLMWKSCPEGFTYSNGACTASGTTSYAWSDALTLPPAQNALNNGSGFANKTGWRLPNIKELQSIVEEKCQLPALNLSAFPAAIATAWSNSPAVDALLANSSWYIDFSTQYGNTMVNGRLNKSGVRLVRDCPECN
ncbi:DUF1566 domain-containing protein [Candidatus Electronema sp. JM]|uniref:Lcl C-terminal domain-containing protein n=1 Tax=Candidatus Electronema sp. JM TaxID=3401571 RepID=UPI003AA81D4C